MVDFSQIRYSLVKTSLRNPLVWYRHKKLRREDVFIASYPRSGSTWMRFLLYELLACEPAEFISVQENVPGVEDQKKAKPLVNGSGRLLQTHEFYRNEYHRAIYLVRDVRDVVISEFYFWQRKGVIKDNFDSYFHNFLYGRVNPFGQWGPHIISWLDSQEKKSGEVFVLRFEDLRKDPEGVLRDILRFLNVPRDPETIRQAIANNTLDRMREKENQAPKTIFRANRMDIRFIRKGSIGGWQEMLSQDQVQQIEKRYGQILIRLGYSISNSG
jgi:hypothetical protein